MSATTPLWVPLTIAVVGLATTIGAATLTQRWASRREDVRWGRERDDRQEQWQREGKARREQWQREDSLRWHQDRQQAYARLIAVLDEWDRAIGDAIAARKVDVDMADLEEYTRIWPTEGYKAEFNRRMRTVHEALALVQFMAPEKVAELATRAVIQRQALEVFELGKNPFDADCLNARRGDLYRYKSELLTAMRETLGLEIGREDADA